MLVIGEAASHVPDDIRQRHDQVEWRKIVGLRNIVIHRYASVDEEIVWDVVQNSVPNLRDQLRALLQTERER